MAHDSVFWAVKLGRHYVKVVLLCDLLQPSSNCQSLSRAPKERGSNLLLASVLPAASSDFRLDSFGLFLEGQTTLRRQNASAQ